MGKGEGSVWYIELVAHQSSLPLGLVILYQNYRFAFGDLFLKRAISVILLAAVASALYAWVAAPLLRYHETHDRNDALASGLILVLWMVTALTYPALHRAAVWVVDTVILRRPDYVELRAAIAGEIDQLEEEEAVVGAIRERLATALTAERADTSEEAGPLPAHQFWPERAALVLPTAEAPFHRIGLNELKGGRRILSEESAMLQDVAAAAEIEPVHIPELCLDVLAQQLVATCAERTFTVDETIAFFEEWLLRTGAASLRETRGLSPAQAV